MTGSGDTQSIFLTWDLPHTPAKVWRALTEPALLAQWLMANDMRPSVGHSFTFQQDPTPWWDGIVHCEVLELQPHKLIRYTWRSGAGASELDTVVTWTLAPTSSGGTRLALEHSGFVRKNAFAFAGAKEGWERMVGRDLAAVLAGIT